MEKREYSCTVGGNVNWYSYYGWQLIWRRFLKKVEIKLLYDPAIPLLGIYPEKTIIQKRDVYPNVHCRTLYNNYDMEAIQMFSDGWIKKLCYL